MNKILSKKDMNQEKVGKLLLKDNQNIKGFIIKDKHENSNSIENFERNFRLKAIIKTFNNNMRNKKINKHSKRKNNSTYISVRNKKNTEIVNKKNNIRKINRTNSEGFFHSKNILFKKFKGKQFILNSSMEDKEFSLLKNSYKDNYFSNYSSIDKTKEKSKTEKLFPTLIDYIRLSYRINDDKNFYNLNNNPNNSKNKINLSRQKNNYKLIPLYHLNDNIINSEQKKKKIYKMFCYNDPFKDLENEFNYNKTIQKLAHQFKFFPKDYLNCNKISNSSKMNLIMNHFNNKVNNIIKYNNSSCNIFSSNKNSITNLLIKKHFPSKSIIQNIKRKNKIINQSH